ncbi:hypothetical protein RHMOL_Rhmol05G0019500 [Rhododendron molle]|uniref:Uncharacterized protein n=1 Tax=Rhododendron molle TaxID=49168 RepID=A0ACC0NLL0_RHOML|nr:hypothetical protein RHMOL_Rhmol05G0019500 [Rhododendron molle]
MHLEEVSSRIEVPNLIGSLGCWPTKHLPAAWLVERSLSLLFSLLGFLSLYTIAQPFTGSIELIESISHGVADRSDDRVAISQCFQGFDMLYCCSYYCYDGGCMEFVVPP